MAVPPQRAAAPTAGAAAVPRAPVPRAPAQSAGSTAPRAQVMVSQQSVGFGSTPAYPIAGSFPGQGSGSRPSHVVMPSSAPTFGHGPPPLSGPPGMPPSTRFSQGMALPFLSPQGAYFPAPQPQFALQPLQPPYRGHPSGGAPVIQQGVSPQQFAVGVGNVSAQVPKRKKKKKQDQLQVGLQPGLQSLQQPTQFQQFGYPADQAGTSSQVLGQQLQYQYGPQGTVDDIPQADTAVETVVAAPVPTAAGKKIQKSVRCWKCAVNTHATKDCKAVHNCYICDNSAHPTLRCPVLKQPRPTPVMSGIGNELTLFSQIPDSVVRGHLGANLTPIALVQVTGPMVPADVVQRQIARRCPVRSQWKWEALPYGESAFLVSFPSMEDLDRVDGIQVPVPLCTSQLSFSVYRTQEVPHKLELQQVWLHVEGVPHCLRSFLGLWAVGGLMGTTLDVDLFSLRRRGVVRILVAMTDTSVFLGLQDSLGHYTMTDAVVGLKAYELRFRLEPEGYVPEPEFAPYLWRKRDGDQDDDANEKPSDDAMDTSDMGGGSQAVGAGSSSTTARQGGSAQPPTRQVVQLDCSVPSDPVLLFAVTPFNANPATPRGKELLEALPLDSPLRGSGPVLCSPRVSPSQLQEALHVACGSLDKTGVSSLPASPTRGRPNMMGRSIPTRADPVIQEVVPVMQEVVSGSSTRRRAQVGFADRGAVGLAAGAQGASPMPLAVQPPSTLERDSGGPSDGACPVDMEGRSSSDGGPVTGWIDLIQEGLGLSPAAYGPDFVAETPARRSSRHAVDALGASATDEDSLGKAMRRKAEKNLDTPGYLSSYGCPPIMDFTTTNGVPRVVCGGL
uniref:Uncharacterized protein n=1 Tax=Avena sativa TaxID=4498 RepID=A0ACD5Y0U9_AVESA